MIGKILAAANRKLCKWRSEKKTTSDLKHPEVTTEKSSRHADAVHTSIYFFTQKPVTIKDFTKPHDRWELQKQHNEKKPSRIFNLFRWYKRMRDQKLLDKESKKEKERRRQEAYEDERIKAFISWELENRKRELGRRRHELQYPPIPVYKNTTPKAKKANVIKETKYEPELWSDPAKWVSKKKINNREISTSAKPRSTEKQVSVNNYSKDSITNRFVNYCYRLCCQFYCWLTCILVFVYIVVFLL